MVDTVRAARAAVLSFSIPVLMDMPDTLACSATPSSTTTTDADGAAHTITDASTTTVLETEFADLFCEARKRTAT